MDSLLQQHTSFIRQCYKTYSNTTPNDFIIILDKIVSFLNNTESQIDGFNVIARVSHELSTIVASNIFENVHVMQHIFFIIIGRTLEMLLSKAAFMLMTKPDQHCFYETSNLIVKLCLYRNNPLTNFCLDNKTVLNSSERIFYQQLFVTKSFLDKLARVILNEVAVHNYDAYDVIYKVVGQLLSLCTDLNHFDHDVLLDSIVACLRSENYLNVYETIDLREPILNPKQLFFMYHCPRFIRLCNYERQHEISNALYGTMLEFTEKIFNQHLPIALEGETIVDSKDHTEKLSTDDRGAKVQVIGWHIAFMNHLVLSYSTKSDFITSTVLDRLIDIVTASSLITNVLKIEESFDSDVELLSSAIVLLYNLISDERVLFTLKEKQFEETCKKLHQAKNKTIKFVSKTLSILMNQEHIDEINNCCDLTQNYLSTIENTVYEPLGTYRGIKIDSILANLEILTQNDRIKNEIVNDVEGISLLATCTMDQNLDLETVRFPALRIIRAVSFAGENACKKIRNNGQFMNFIRHLASTNDPMFGLTAHYILWKVNDEQNFITQQTNKQAIVEQQQIRIDWHWDLTEHHTSNVYSLMINYHHSDQDVCKQIYDRLASSNFSRITFNEEHVDEMLPSAIAETIEKASVVLICFSNQYQTSYACRLAAEYAEKRQRSMIAVKLDESFRPTGWLNHFLADKQSIDVLKHNLYSTCANLTQRINEIHVKINKS